MEKTSKIYVAGHLGLVGSAIIKSLQRNGYENVLYRSVRQLDLRNTEDTSRFFQEERPEYVFLIAAKVGSIHANNTYRAEFIYDNLMIQNNVIHQAYLNGVKKLLFLGSSSIYPKEVPQPINESSLLAGPIEYTNEPYAVAKIAGIKMCESYNLQYGCNFLSVLSANLYGPNDNFDLPVSHVIPSLVRKMYLGKALEEENWDFIMSDIKRLPIDGKTGAGSKEEALSRLNEHGVYRRGNEITVEIWGSGQPMREFLWSEEMANACLFVMETVSFHDVMPRATQEVRNTHINIGTGKQISIKALAELIQTTVGYRGNLFFNTAKPDGPIHKLTDPSKIHSLGWKHQINVEQGVKMLCEWYLNPYG